MVQNYPYQFSLTCLKGLTQPTLNAFFKLNFSDFFLQDISSLTQAA